MFDHCASTKDQLSFKKDDILYITDTLYNGHVGSWKAWIVNKEDAQQRESGMIPSRMKYATFFFIIYNKLLILNLFYDRADQILLLRLSVGQSDVDNKLAGRRSFFRRSKKGSYSFNVGHSQESSDTTLSTCTGMIFIFYCNYVYWRLHGINLIFFSLELPVSYQNVERLDSKCHRFSYERVFITRFLSHLYCHFRSLSETCNNFGSSC